MEKPPSARPCPPELPAAESRDGWLDSTQAFLLAKETEAALRWGAALEAVAARYTEVARELAAYCRGRLVANLGQAAPLLTILPSRERVLLIEQLETRTYEKGQELMTEGDDSSGLHLLAAGEVAVVVREGPERLVLAALGGGDTLGEVELVLCRRANADAIAVRPTTTLFLSRERFLALAAEQPAIAHALYMTALRRDAEIALAMGAPAAVADGDLLDDPVASSAVEEAPRPDVQPVEPAGVPMPVSVGTPSIAPAATLAPASTLPPATASRRPASPRRRSLALPAMIGAGAFAAAVALPVALAVLLGRHGDSSAATALEAKNAIVATEAPTGTGTAAELLAVPSAPAVAGPVKVAASAARPRAAAPMVHVASSSSTAPARDPHPPSASRGAAAASPRTDEFGGRE